MFSTVTSAFSSNFLTISTPRGDLRSMAKDRLLALNMWKYHGSSGAFPGSTRRAGSPVFGFSILTTSAPSQASASVQDGPASNWVKSTTRTPARHSSSWQLSLIAGLLSDSRGAMVHDPALGAVTASTIVVMLGGGTSPRSVAQRALQRGLPAATPAGTGADSPDGLAPGFRSADEARCSVRYCQ